MTHHRAHSDDRLDDATLTRYLSGSCEPAARERVERWLAADPAHRAELAALKAAWNPPPVPEPDPNDQMWHWIAARMDEPLPRSLIVFPAYVRWFGLIAAALIVVLGGALLFRLPGRILRSGVSAPLASAAMRELVTPRGARVTGNLPDGSRVILGPDSRLQIATTFAATPSMSGSRDVHLQGEAFFEVTHDSTRPFRVHTAHGVAEDLGTEFVVTAYPETPRTRVVVASGVVALRRRGATASGGVTLHAGDLGRIEASGAETLTRNVNVSTYVGWTQGSLVFDEMPLDDAIIRLGRWYALDIRLADTTLARRRVTATFQDEPVSQVLRVLEVMLDVRAERTGQLVVLRPLYPVAAPSR